MNFSGIALFVIARFCGWTRIWMFPLKRWEEMGRVLSWLPGIDCGVCGAPNCRAFAEDIRKGSGDKKRECILYTVK